MKALRVQEGLRGGGGSRRIDQFREAEKQTKGYVYSTELPSRSGRSHSFPQALSAMKKMPLIGEEGGTVWRGERKEA